MTRVRIKPLGLPPPMREGRMYNAMMSGTRKGFDIRQRPSLSVYRPYISRKEKKARAMMIMMVTAFVIASSVSSVRSS
jgi:hypothetical protein